MCRDLPKARGTISGELSYSFCIGFVSQRNVIQLRNVFRKRVRVAGSGKRYWHDGFADADTQTADVRQ